MRIFENLHEVAAAVGQELAVSEWLEITQAQINLFAEATGDHQWIHVDPERAKAGPFGTPVAHGFLTLSLLPRFFETALQIKGTRMGVNYGLNKVRFTAPVPVGSRLRSTHSSALGPSHRTRRAADGVGGSNRMPRKRQAGMCGGNHRQTLQLRTRGVDSVDDRL